MIKMGRAAIEWNKLVMIITHNHGLVKCFQERLPVRWPHRERLICRQLRHRHAVEEMDGYAVSEGNPRWDVQRDLRSAK